jgi:monovalent cation:H+ antiporter, CPA1 family
VIFGMTAVLGRTRERFPISWATVLTWGGLRGALPMVLALSLPRDFAHRELIVNMTFGVVAISILVHGLSMSSLLKGLRIVTKAQKRLEYESARGRYRTAKAALSALDDIGKAGLGATEMVDVVRREYESQLHETEDEIHHVHLKREEIRQDELQWIRRRLVLVEKEELIEAFREGAVGRDVYEELLADCDARLLELDRNEYEPREAAGESDAQTGPES